MNFSRCCCHRLLKSPARVRGPDDVHRYGIGALLQYATKRGLEKGALAERAVFGQLAITSNHCAERGWRRPA